jgi:flagellar biosynthesis protein
VSQPAHETAAERDSPERARAPLAAVALRYERESERAPMTLARGRGEVAQRILEIAREAGVPVREDQDLLELLALCEVGEEIPSEIYGAVAEVIAFLYRLNGELAER